MKIKLMAKLVLVSTLFSSSAFAQVPNCSTGPQCQALGAKAQQYIAQMDSKIRAGAFMGASEAAAKAYCLAMLTAEVSRACGEEFESTGQTQCSALTSQQRDQALEAAKQSEIASRETSSGSNWQAECGW